MDKKLTIGLAGDTMLGRGVGVKILQEDYVYPWGNLLPLLRSTDLSILNLETTLTTSKEIVPKVFNFKADPKIVQCLKVAEIDIVSLANNHIRDFGNSGLIETIEVLDKSDILHAGAGRNVNEAKKPVIIERNGIKIGVIACTDNEPTWKADERPGIHYVKIGDLDAITADIKTLRDQVDILILSIHWGPNMRERPTQEFVNFAHRLIDSGVDIIHGHSAHIFQGIELYKKGIILYDTGDFVDDYVVDPFLRNDHSFLFQVEIDHLGLRQLKLKPVIISKSQVNLATGEHKNWCIERMQELSAELGTQISDEGSLFIRE